MARVLNRPVPIGCTAQMHTPSTVLSTSAAEAKRTSAPPARLQSVEADIASTCNRNPITCMTHAMLNDNKDMNPDDSIVIKAKLNILSPEEYSDSSDLEVYETFVTGILCWLKMKGLLDTKHASF